MADSVYYLPTTGENKINNPVKKDFAELSKKDLIFAVLFICISFLIVDFVFFHGFNLGFTISYFILFALTSAYLFNKKNKLSVFSGFCGVLSLAGAAAVPFNSDFIIVFITVCATLFLFILYTCALSATFRNNEGSFKVLSDVLCSAAAAPFANAGELKSSAESRIKNNKSYKNIFIGFAVSVPVLLVIVPLLSHGDAAFGSLVNTVFDIDSIGIAALRIALTLALGLYFILYMFSKKKNLKTCSERTSNTGKSKEVFPASAVLTFLSIISVTYLVYMFSQLAYFFSAFSGILPDGYKFSASEYARRGFFEMFAVCVINMLIITITNIFTKRKKGRAINAVKAVCLFIMLFTTLLLVTSAAKMKLNIECYGMSKNRLLVSLFMAMIFIVIVFYIIHIFKPKANYMQSIIVICGAILIAMSFMNIDKFIAKYNVEAYQNGKLASVDAEYLSNLSVSALPYIAQLADDENESVAKEARLALMRKLRENNDIINMKSVNKGSEAKTAEYKKCRDIRQLNFAKEKAYTQTCDVFNSLPEAKREILDNYYNLSAHWYDEENDTFDFEGDDGYYVYSYNQKTKMYELNEEYSEIENDEA